MNLWNKVQHLGNFPKLHQTKKKPVTDPWINLNLQVLGPCERGWFDEVSNSYYLRIKENSKPNA